MKNGKKPTLAQKKFLQGKGLVPENWLIVKDTPVELVVVSRAALLKRTGKTKLSGRSDYESHGEKSHSNAGRTGKRVERSASLLPVASVQESQNCDETDAGRFCEAIIPEVRNGGWMRWVQREEMYFEPRCVGSDPAYSLIW